MPPRSVSVAASVLVAGLVYACAWAVLPHDGLFINDNGCKLIQTEGLVRNGGADFSVPWPGRDVDPGLSFRPLGDPFGTVARGKLFVSFPIPFALITSLPYRLFGTGGLTLLPFLSGLLLLPALAALAGLLGAGRRGTWCAVLGTALGTPVWFYAYTLWEHLPAVCLLTWGLVLLLRAQAGRGGGGVVALAALLCGLAVWLRDDAVLFALAMAVIPLAARGPGPPLPRQRRDTILFVAVLLATLVPLGIGQWIVLGTPLGFHATTHGPFEHGAAGYVIERWTVFRDLVIDSHQTEWVSLLGGIPYVLLLLLHPALAPRRFALAGELLLLWAVGWGAVAYAGHLSSRAPIWYLPSANGLFAVSPFLILACLRVSEPAEAVGRDGAAVDDRLRTALWLVVLIDLGLYVLLAPPLHVAGIHWGSRLLMPLFPVLGVLAGATAGRLVRLRQGAARARAVALVVLALVLSAAFQLHGLRLLDAEERFEARLVEEVMRRPEKTVIATSWVVPQELARCFYDKRIFLVRTPVDLQRLVPMLQGAGVGGGETRVLIIDAAPSVAGAPATDQLFSDGLDFMTYRLTEVDLR
ncbi:MAG TPA: hypothetical protein VFB49_00305 [Patescibacteria group bacterium]|nr:hypothetical protein [Patescibacteria group bacterium]